MKKIFLRIAIASTTAFLNCAFAAANAPSTINFNVVDRFKLAQTLNGSDVLQNGEPVFIFSIDKKQAYCKLNSPFEMQQGQANIVFAGSKDSSGNAMFTAELISQQRSPSGRSAVIFCESYADRLELADIQQALSNVISLKTN